MTPARRHEWIRLWVVLGVAIGSAALVSPWLALLVGGILLGGWALLWVMVMAGFDVVIWVLRRALDVAGALFDAATAPQRAQLGATHADIARHVALMQARYPERYADVERETYDRRSVFLGPRPPFDYEGTLARYKARQAELARSAELFLQELRDGNARHDWYDATELAAEEETIRSVRRDPLAERGDQGRRDRLAAFAPTR